MEVKLERSDIRRQAIVDAGVALADSDGIAAVTMRQVAERLGVGTMTLYSYVANKDELVDLMLDEVSREMLVPVPLPGNWRDALRAIALRTRDAMQLHPWMFEATTRRLKQRVNFLRHVEQSLAAVASLELDGETTTAILTAVDDYTLGHAVRHRARQRIVREARAAAARGESRGGEEPSLDPAIAAAVEAGELPLVAQVFGTARGGASRPQIPPESDFERGLDWLLDGIEAWLGRRANE
jgi:AcrR family transcriptional regulator